MHIDAALADRNLDFLPKPATYSLVIRVLSISYCLFKKIQEID